MAQPAFRYVKTEAAEAAPAWAHATAPVADMDNDSPVAALHATILRRFAELDAGKDMSAPDIDAGEQVIAFVSRWGGVVLFVAAAAGCVIAIL